MELGRLTMKDQTLSPLEPISLPQSMLIGFIKFEDIAIAATAKLGPTLMTQLDP